MKFQVKCICFFDKIKNGGWRLMLLLYFRKEFVNKEKYF